MVINPVLKNRVLSHCQHRPKPFQIPLLSPIPNPSLHQNPIPKPYYHCKQIYIYSEATEPEHNPYLYRKEDDEVVGAVEEERQEFKAWIVRERDGGRVESDGDRERW